MGIYTAFGFTLFVSITCPPALCSSVCSPCNAHTLYVCVNMGEWVVFSFHSVVVYVGSMFLCHSWQ